MSISDLTLISFERSLVAIFGAFALYLFGDYTSLMKLLVFVIGLDFVTGVLKAAKQQRLNSCIGRNGVFRKIGMCMGVVFAHFIDVYAGSGDLFRNLIINFFIITEFISISENLLALGVTMPKFIREFLENTIDKSQYKIKSD
jgi:toxin secretion/phage lysis holin